MKILFVNCFYWPDLAGGAERSVKRLADLHVKAGHEVSVLTTHAGPGMKVDDIDGAKVYRIPPHNIYWAKQADQPSSWKRMLWHGLDSFNFLSYRDTSALLQRIRPDVISSQNLPGLSSSTWAAAHRLGIPLVQVLRDYYSLCPRSTMNRDGHNCQRVCSSCKVFRLPHERLSNRVSAVVGCSQAVLDKHLQHGLFADVPVKRVIYNAEHISPPGTRQSPADGPFTFGYIGALTEVKGIPPMLRAFQAAQRLSARPLRMVVAGTGPESYVRQLKADFASPDIEFIGHAQPAALYLRSDATIVASVWDDPLPGVAFQALAHGVPVIGTRRGGIPEMVQDQHNGLLYDPDQPEALQDAMNKMANEPGLHAQLVAHTVASAAPFLSESRLFEDYMSVYGEAMSKGLTLRPAR